MDDMQRRRRARDAAQEYRKLTESDAADPKAWYGLGKAYESLAARCFEVQNSLM